MKKGNIFWGVILLTLGVLFALRNFDIFYFNWGSVFRLWPVILILWGIAILPLKSLVKLVLTLLTVIIAIVILAQNPGPSYHWFNWWPDKYTFEREYEEHPWAEQHLNEDFDEETKYVKLNLDAAAGDFNIKGVTTKLYELDTEGNTGPYSVVSKQNGSTKTINIKHKKFSGHKDFKNDVWLSLNTEPIWNLDIDVGAAGLDMDLTPFETEKINIDGGASSIEMRIGNRAEKTIISVDAGASSIEIEIPRESACEIQTSTILSSRELEGFNKIKSGLYQTPNFSDSANQIFIDIDAAVSSLKVDMY